MKNSDPKNIFIHFRFVIVVILSIVAMALDVRTKALSDFRYYVESSLYPLLILADSPHSVGKIVKSQFKDHGELIKENENLATTNYMQRAEILKLRDLEAENQALRKLLNSPARPDAKKLFAEVIDVDPDPYMHRVIVNRGSSSGVYEGMPVITDKGLVGQVMNVNYSYSRVLLATDPNCSIPVMDSRSFVRAIAQGSGTHDEILINNAPRSADIKVGDILSTSGIGGVYPKGYPLAQVTSVGTSESQPFAAIKAKPLVDIDKMRYVLMFWSDDVSDNADNYVVQKELTDSKTILHQQKVKDLIDTLSVKKGQNKVSNDNTTKSEGVNNVN